MHTEQKRALAYLKRKGDERPFEEAIGRLQRAGDAIEGLLATVGEAAAKRRPGEGRWSVLEVADHLAVSHRQALEQWRRALSGQDPGPAVAAHLLSPDVGTRNFRSVRHELAAVHREWLELASHLTESELSAAPPIPILMVIKGEVEGEIRTFEWIEPVGAKAFALAFAVHTREHEAQVQRALEALASDEALGGGPSLETERLDLRPVALEDAAILREIFDHRDVRRYLFDDQSVGAGLVDEIIRSSLGRFRSHGFGLWLAFSRSPVSLSAGRERGIVGFGGYGFFFEPPELQFYYGLVPEFWGHGLATEMARRLLDYGFEDLGFDRIIGAADAPNAASLRVMERAGMMRLDDRERDGKRTVYFAAERPKTRL